MGTTQRSHKRPDRLAVCLIVGKCSIPAIDGEMCRFFWMVNNRPWRQAAKLCALL
jgi:hypothetical protein